MSCDRFRNELREHALGRLAGRTLTEHLASCERCRSMLAADRARVETLDQRIEDALGSEHPADLAARVRSLVAEGRGGGTRFAEGWRRVLGASLRVPIVAVVAFLVVWTALVVVVARQATSPPPSAEADSKAAHQASASRRAAASEYRGLEGFQPVRKMRIEIVSREVEP